MRRYYWDFYGPAADGTARHFHHHVDEFLEKEAIVGCTTGVETDDSDGSVSAWCTAPDEHQRVIERALRPRRYTED